MKFKNIQNLVPTGEHFDESAIVNEGGFLSVSHMQAIEDVLQNNASALNTATQNLETANASVTSITTERDAAKTSLTTANNTVTSQANEIVELKEKVAALGKGESGNGSKLITTADEKIEQVPVASYLSPDNAANQFFDSNSKRRPK